MHKILGRWERSKRGVKPVLSCLSLGWCFSSKDSLWAECGHKDQRGLFSAASVSPQTWIKCVSALVRAVGSWGEELFVWCFLGPQQNEVESCQEVTHLTDMCMLRFLEHVFEALLAKKELQLVIWGSWHFHAKTSMDRLHTSGAVCLHWGSLH